MLPAHRPTRLSNSFSKPLLPGLLLACSLVLTVVAWYVSHKHLRDKTRARFSYAAANIESAIAVRMSAYEQVLRSAVGLFYASDTVTRADWNGYVRTLRLNERYPGILGLGYCVRLAPADVDRLTRTVRAEGYPGFSVWPAGPRPEYFSVIYLEPLTGRNLRAFGFDMHTEQKRRSAMERARHSGAPSLSEIVVLVQENGRDMQQGCLLYLPVYDRNVPVATAAERSAALRGFVYSPFRINDLMQGILGSGNAEVGFEIYDGRNTDPAHLFYASHAPAKGKADLSSSRLLPVAGHEWTLVFTSQPGLVSAFEANQPNVIAIAGILVNLLLLWVLVKLHSLSSRNRELAERFQAEKERYDIISGSTNDIIWEWDIASNRVQTNRNYGIVLGVPGTDAPVPYEEWASHIHPEDKDRVLQLLKSLAGSGRSDWSAEYRLLRADGSPIHILDRGHLLYDTEGAPVRMLGSMINITARKEAEEAQRRFNEQLEGTVQARTLELQRSNEDLERFAHVASHDLKEPVRKILIFIDVIRARYGQQLGEGLRQLEKLEASAARMKQMIDSILAYSTARYEPQPAEPVDLNAILRNVQEDLELIISEKGARIDALPLPALEGSTVLLHQLFYNLLNNALKFSRDGVPPVVRITAQVLQSDRGELVEISLSDNGIGFSQEEAEGIFQSFVRLHTRDRFEGTGLGLALCKRVVERHGGSIDAVGAPGAGATFLVRLPLKQPAGII